MKTASEMTYTVLSGAVAYLGFCEGGQSQRREVRGAGGANGVECGEGVSPPPLKKGSGEVAVPPPQKLKKIFGSMCSGQRGGHRPVPPPKYATGCCCQSTGQTDRRTDGRPTVT